MRTAPQVSCGQVIEYRQVRRTGYEYFACSRVFNRCARLGVEQCSKELRDKLRYDFGVNRVPNEILKHRNTSHIIQLRQALKRRIEADEVGSRVMRKRLQ